MPFETLPPISTFPSALTVRRRSANSYLGRKDTWILPKVDDRYSFGAMPFVAPAALNHEDSAPNTIHILIMMVAAAIALYRALSSRERSQQFAPRASYLLAAALSMLVFFVLLRWQPWIVRLQLGGFMILIPLVALPLSMMRPKFLLVGIAVVSIQSFVVAFHNRSRPIFGDWSVATASAEDVLFANRRDLKADYLRLADQLAQARPKRVGLIIDEDSWEFPIWYLLRQRLSDQDMPTIVHEIDENSADRAAEFLVYIDTTATPSVAAKTMRIAGFDKIRLYASDRK